MCGSSAKFRVLKLLVLKTAWLPPMRFFRTFSVFELVYPSWAESFSLSLDAEALSDAPFFLEFLSLDVVFAVVVSSSSMFRSYILRMVFLATSWQVTKSLRVLALLPTATFVTT